MQPFLLDHRRPAAPPSEGVPASLTILLDQETCRFFRWEDLMRLFDHFIDAPIPEGVVTRTWREVPNDMPEAYRKLSPGAAARVARRRFATCTARGLSPSR